MILGTLGLTSSCGLAVRLWRSRTGENLSRRWPYLLGFIILVYATQIVTGFILRTSSSQASATVTFVYVLFTVGIARSWELLGLHGGGPLDLLAQHLASREPLSRGSAAPPAPPEPGPGAE